MDRCALFVDAGYMLADGAMAVHGTRNRESVSWDYAGVIQFLGNMARDRTGLPLLRCYWYEATVEGRRTPEHDALADLPGVKLRLARMRPGRREGVEGEIHRDLATLARNRAVSDALVVSAEEDLSQVIADVQDLGMRVTVVHIAVDGNWTISRTLRQECDGILEIGEAHLRPYVELLAGAEPLRDEDRQAIGAYAARAGSNGHGTISAFAHQPALPAGSHPAPPAIYTAPVIAEYQRVAQPLNGQSALASPNAASPAVTRQSPGSLSQEGTGPQLASSASNGDMNGRSGARSSGLGEQPAGMVQPAQGLGQSPGMGGQQDHGQQRQSQPGAGPSSAIGASQGLSQPPSQGLSQAQGISPSQQGMGAGQQGMGAGQQGMGAGQSGVGRGERGMGQDQGMGQSPGMGPGQPGVGRGERGMGQDQGMGQSPGMGPGQPGVGRGERGMGQDQGMGQSPGMGSGQQGMTSGQPGMGARSGSAGMSPGQGGGQQGLGPQSRGQQSLGQPLGGEQQQAAGPSAGMSQQGMSQVPGMGQQGLGQQGFGQPQGVGQSQHGAGQPPSMGSGQAGPGQAGLGQAGLGQAQPGVRPSQGMGQPGMPQPSPVGMHSRQGPPGQGQGAQQVQPSPPLQPLPPSMSGHTGPQSAVSPQASAGIGQPGPGMLSAPGSPVVGQPGVPGMLPPAQGQGGQAGMGQPGMPGMAQPPGMGSPAGMPQPGQSGTYGAGAPGGPQGAAGTPQPTPGMPMQGVPSPGMQNSQPMYLPPPGSGDFRAVGPDAAAQVSAASRQAAGGAQANSGLGPPAAPMGQAGPGMPQAQQRPYQGGPAGRFAPNPQDPRSEQYPPGPPGAPYVPPQGPYSGPQPPAQAPVPPQMAMSLADAVQAAHGEGFQFGQTVARDAPALWLEAVLARKPRMPSDLEARLLQDSALPIDSLLHDEVRHALRRGFWDALERARH